MNEIVPNIKLVAKSNQFTQTRRKILGNYKIQPRSIYDRIASEICQQYWL